MKEMTSSYYVIGGLDIILKYWYKKKREKDREKKDFIIFISISFDTS